MAFLGKCNKADRTFPSCMLPAAPSVLAMAGSGGLGSACWDLHSGELRGFDDLFLSFADLARSVAFTVVGPTWIDVLGGKEAKYLYESTRQLVSQSIAMLDAILVAFRNGKCTEEAADMTFVTRVGRQRVPS